MREIKVMLDGKEIAIGALTVYRGEEEEYVTFLTPECLELWHRYKEDREHLGEAITEDSPLIRNVASIFARHCDGRTRRKYPSVRPMRAGSIRDLFSDAWNRAGVLNRKFKEVHGFRKFTKTELEDDGMKTLHVEIHLGHGAGSYYRAQKLREQGLDSLQKDLSESKRAIEFVKHMHVLYIDPKYEAERKATEAISQKERVEKDYLAQLIITQKRNEMLEEKITRIEEILEQFTCKGK